jgi:hypothetical protein
MFSSFQYKTNLVALSKSALGQTLMVNQLVDMEWKFGGMMQIIPKLALIISCIKTRTDNEVPAKLC